MAKNTAKTYLYSSSDGTTYAKLCDITSYPDLLTPPPRLDSTTLTDTQHTYIKDIADVPDLAFGANYDKTTFNTLKGYESASRHYQVWFGDNGADGKWTWQGESFTAPKGGKVGAVREMELTLYPATAIVFS